MDVQDLEAGQKAPDNSDRIVVAKLVGGKFGFSGVVLQGDVHAHFYEHGEYDTPEAARAAGIAWASEKQGIETLLVERDA